MTRGLSPGGARIALARAGIFIVVLVIAGAGGFAAYQFAGMHRSGLSPTPASWRPQASAQSSARAPDEPTAAASNGAAPSDGAAMDRSRPAASIPQLLPDISLPDRDGVRRKLTDWKGRPLLVNFWATWCPPCRREIPLLRSLHRERSAQGLEIVGIAVDFRQAVIEYAQAQRMDYPVLIAEEGGLNAVEAFGMEAVFPFSVFADRAGRIITLKVGELQRDEAEFILDRVRDLDEGRIDLATAREQIAAGRTRLAVDRARRPDANSTDPGQSKQEIP